MQDLALRRARLAASAAFFSQGLIFVSQTTRLPALQERWGLTELTLSLVLLGMVLPLARFFDWRPQS